MINRIWNYITTHVCSYYTNHKDDIIIGFIVATIIGILFKATVYTWFVSLCFTLTYQLVVIIYQYCRKKSSISIRINPIIINFIIGVFISLLFTVWQ